MAFVFDALKSRKNKQKHGIDFIEAQSLWGDINCVSFTARTQNEDRYGIIAIAQQKLWCAIYTLRGQDIRIISVRRARDYEKKLYYNS